MYVIFHLPMPFYDFRCEKCGHRFSKMLPLGANKAECHLCGAEAKKMISAPAVHFSGSGFYASDNRKPNTPSPAKSETTEKPKTEEKNKTKKNGAKE